MYLIKRWNCIIGDINKCISSFDIYIMGNGEKTPLTLTCSKLTI